GRSPAWAGAPPPPRHRRRRPTRSRSLSVSCHPSPCLKSRYVLPVGPRTLKLSVRLLYGGASLGGPRATSMEVDLLDDGAFTQEGRTGGGDRQQYVLADLRVLFG